MAKEIGIITEQGDLGFGFDPLNKSDEKIYTEAMERQQGQKQSNNVVITEGQDTNKK